MSLKPDDLPSDLASAQAALLIEREALRAEREARLRAEVERDATAAKVTRIQAEAINWQAEAANARAELSDNEALIAHLELRIEKLKRELYGQRSERTARLIEQLELELEELVTTASEDELAAQAAAAKAQSVRSFTRKRPLRKPWPDDIERERVVIEAPTTCACCGGSRLAKIGEDVTKTLEEIPRRFKLIETVREKFTCRDCEKITQPPAPFHATPRGFIGPQLLATILFDKFGMHIPLNRQSARFKCEGIDLPLSTLADQVGHGTFAVMPLFHLIERHVLAAERLHGDDTTIRILAKGKCTTGRIWTYVRDDRPFAGPAPPAATDEASIPRSIWPPSPVSCKPIAITASSRCSTRRRRCGRLRQRFALPMRGGASSSWLTSRRMLGKVRRANRSLRSRWRRSDASMRCSRSSAPLMAAARTSGAPCARKRASRFSKTCMPGCSASAKPSRAPPRF
jgi:transposase